MRTATLCLAALAALVFAAAAHTAPKQERILVRQAETPAGLPTYSRGDWRHWTDDDRDCQDTRNEVLAAESRKPVKYRTGRRCVVARGLWVGWYTGRKVRNPRSFDIDHLVPLANAHRSGGWAWTPAKKRRYANSLKPPYHLVAVSASANRSKGDRGPERWRPPRKRSWCGYSTSWAKVKRRWGLTVTMSEAVALREMLSTCKRKVTLLTRPWTHPPAPPPPPSTSGDPYASCEAAQAAGEPLVQGSKGNGRGYPKHVVPSARDGDGDGVVCER